jgi:hypothetical protein
MDTWLVEMEARDMTSPMGGLEAMMARGDYPGQADLMVSCAEGCIEAKDAGDGGARGQVDGKCNSPLQVDGHRASTTGVCSGGLVCCAGAESWDDACAGLPSHPAHCTVRTPFAARMP